MTRVNLSSIVGGGYADFWRFRGRYRIVKGGRASKKSTTAALWTIYSMMKHPGANTLVVRKTYNAHKDSTYAQLLWAINRLQVRHLWQARLSPLEIVYKPTGQKILFRGMDDPMAITSITVATGYLCWVWIEEAYQIMNEEDFDKLDTSIRGDTGDLWKQFTLTFNPWNEKHWLKRRFFDMENPSTLAMTTNYLCNEFLDEADRTLYEWMKANKPRRYSIEGLGNWGIAEGAIYEDWREQEFDWHEIATHPGAVSAYGLDFGYSVDPSAFVASIFDIEEKEIYIYDEHYERAMTNDRIAEVIRYKGFAKERIVADSAEPKSIQEIRKHGVQHIRSAAKGRDSILNGIQFLQQFTIIVHPHCVNTIIELSNYVWSTDKDGSLMNKPIDEYNHLMDALRYSAEPILRNANSKLIVPGSKVKTAQVVTINEAAETLTTSGTVTVEAEMTKYLPSPALKQVKKNPDDYCPDCNSRYTQRRGSAKFCPTHGWSGQAGLPQEFVQRG